MADAINFLGEMVYVSNYEDFKNYGLFKLVGVTMYDDCYSVEGFNEQYSYKYFILAKDIKFKKEKEKVLRPFKDLNEFTDVTGHNIGDVITVHRVNNIFDETCIINGYKILIGMENPIVHIMLGTDKYTLEELSQYFKYQKYGEWHPFGIEE